MTQALVLIDGVTYKTQDLSRVSALAILRASEELPALGLKTTWEDLTALMLRAGKKGETFTETEGTWALVMTVWSTLNGSGVEASLRQAMDFAPDVQITELPEDHQGKAHAPQTRQGSARGGAKATSKAKRTRSSLPS